MVAPHERASGTKLPTLALILLPTAFIALRSPLVLAILPSLALRFIALKSAYWSTDWHYNATVMPIVFIAAIDGIARMQAGLSAGRRGSGNPGPGSNEPPGGCLRRRSASTTARPRCSASPPRWRSSSR